MMHDTHELAYVYLRYWRENNFTDSWAYDKLHELVSADPDFCWNTSLEMVKIAESKKALCCVAAGPLEDLLKSSGTRFIKEAESKAKECPKFLYALSNIWLDEKDAAYEGWLKILFDFGITSPEAADCIIEDNGFKSED